MSITDLFQIQHPLIQAPMAGVQDSALAIAASNAGALGSLPCAMLSVAQMQKELLALHSGTRRPYNVNFFCHQNALPDTQVQARWEGAMAGYYREFGIDPASIAAAAARRPFDVAAADILQAFKPPVVSFHFGLPEPALLQRVKSWGSKVISSATTVEEALWLQSHGVDAIIAQGLEAGGHRGMFLTTDVSTQMGTFALLPQIVRAVQIPVVAAGGIADPSTVSAALALGAAGVQVGTAYLLSSEALTSSVHRAALQSSGAVHTALTNVFTGRPARGIVNRLMREQGLMSPDAPVFPWAGGATAPLRAKAEAAGSGDFSPLWAGQNASSCRAANAADITRSLMEGCAM